LIFSASFKVFPLAISVVIEEEATAATHPSVSKPISLIFSSLETLIYIFIKSPQTGFPTIPTPSGFLSLPLFFGFKK